MTATVATETTEITATNHHRRWWPWFIVLIVIGVAIWILYLAGGFRWSGNSISFEKPSVQIAEDRLREIRDRIAVQIRGVPDTTVNTDMVSADGHINTQVVTIVDPKSGQKVRVRITTQQLSDLDPDVLGTGVVPTAPPTETVVTTPPTPATVSAPPAVGCKLVRIERADTAERTSWISVRFRTEVRPGIVNGLADCINATPGTVLEKSPDPQGGLKVRIGLVGGVGQIALPNSFTEGTADQVVCSRSGDLISHQKYAMSWRSTVPDTLRLRRLDSYDRAKADAGCKAISS